MDPTGFKRLSKAYMAENPPQSEIQPTRILRVPDRYGDRHRIEEELDLPGWTPDLIEHLTQSYSD